MVDITISGDKPSDVLYTLYCLADAISNNSSASSCVVPDDDMADVLVGNDDGDD